MTLTKTQTEIVNSNENKILVVSAAGSGKTTVITERIKRLLDEGADPSSIVAITFTNNAADEMAERLGFPQGVFINTIHSYCNYILCASGYETSNLLDNEQFDKLFELVKEHPDCIKHISHLIVDEYQDTTEEQQQFLDMLAPDNWCYVGDFRQSMYYFAHAYPQHMIDLSKDSSVTVFEMKENYRCGSLILDYAKGIIRGNGIDFLDNSIAARDTKGKVIDIEYNPQAIARTILKYGNYSSWFILARTNAEVDEVARVMNDNKVPNRVIRRAEFNNEELRKELSTDTVKIMTIHGSKGLANDNVIVIGAKFFSEEEVCISYVAATRARDLLVWTRKPIKRKRGITQWET